MIQVHLANSTTFAVIVILQISCEKVIIEKDDVAKGLEELIAHYGIAKLVVGAAADECYSKYV